ncbi:MAG: alpha/beta hydrolase [Deltaproteobacteria bacterium]|jgi:3-oxoadipate enol-lactonase|nr:alpha/beta hydrolase [Deltaproteobacteria bacterium]
MPFVPVGGIDLYCEQAGEGPRLLFINGTGGDLRQKPRLIDGPLAGAFEILAYDQRGLGRSGKPDEPYSMAGYADDAAGLLDQVGWERCHVLGVSFGGMVAQELALRHPDRVDRLVLACTSSGGEGGVSYPLHELEEQGSEEYMRRVIAIGDRRWSDAQSGRDPRQFEKILEIMWSRQGQFDSGEDPSLVAIGSRRQLEARMAHDTWDRLPDIEAETFLAAGRYDGIAKPENMENLARRIPNATLEFFEGGHIFLLEDRSAFRRIIGFLKGECA